MCDRSEPEGSERRIGEPQAGGPVDDAIEIGVKRMGSAQQVRPEVDLSVNGSQNGGDNHGNGCGK